MKMLLTFLVAASLAAQQPTSSKPAGVIAGVLAAADTGQPVRKAQLKLVSAATRMTRTTTSDGDGHFAFAELAAGDYTLSASKPSFLDAVFGARRPGPAGPGTPIHVGQDQKIENVALRIARGGVIAGAVFDEFGDPSFNTLVRALRFVFVDGERTLTPAGQATTDDLGAYRLAGLLPGEYLVSAIPRDTVQTVSSQAEAMRDRFAATGRTVTAPALEPINPIGYAPIYHPGTATPASAVNVSVGLSGQVAGVDIRLQVVHTATVRGVVVGADGAPVGGANLQLIDPSLPVANIGVWFRTARPDGGFSFSGVAPGTYVLRGQGGLAGAHVTAAATVIADSLNTGSVELRLERGSTISGRLALDTLTAPVTLSRVRVELRPILSTSDWERASSQATPDVSARFTIRGVEAGRYRIAVAGLPSGWTLSSAMFGERDAVDAHLTVEPDSTYTGGVLKFTDKSSDVSGTLTTAAGKPGAGYVVLLFPENRALWVPQSRWIQVALSSADGRYALTGLPHGDYRIIAVQDPEPGREFDPEFLGQLITSATAIALGDGEKRTQDLRVR